MDASTADELRKIHEKLEKILLLLEKQESARPLQARSKNLKERPAPLTHEEISKHAAKFDELFEAWNSGHEVEVEKELDAMDVEEIRRFADANNLNVTSKMAKQKVMQLIAGRFRERKQLLRSHFRNEPSAS